MHARLVLQGQPGAHRDLGAHDAVATEKVVFLLVVERDCWERLLGEIVVVGVSRVYEEKQGCVSSCCD